MKTFKNAWSYKQMEYKPADNTEFYLLSLPRELRQNVLWKPVPFFKYYLLGETKYSLSTQNS